jgi:hypothetical protein
MRQIHLTIAVRQIFVVQSSCVGQLVLERQCS